MDRRNQTTVAGGLHPDRAAGGGGKPKLHDRFLIHNEQERWELVPMLPVCGVQSPTGGLVGLARQGATDAWCAAETDGCGNGTVAMGAMFRRQWADPVNWEDREFRHHFLSAGENLDLSAADWREWYDRRCDFFGYAWGTPPDFRPHPRYAADLELVRRAFREMAGETP